MGKLSTKPDKIKNLKEKQDTADNYRSLFLLPLRRIILPPQIIGKGMIPMLIENANASVADPSDIAP